MSFHKQLVGGDLHAPSQIQVENNTGVDIPAMKCVTFNGMGTNYPQVVLANGALANVRGITVVDFPTATTTYIYSLGFAYNLNTSAWAVGTALYSDNFGNISTTPNGPRVATVESQNATSGVLYIELSFGNSGGGGSGDVVGPPSSTDKAIVVWDGTTGQLLEDGPGTEVQPSGAIVAQGFITNQDVTGLVTVGSDQAWVAPSLNLTLTGAIDLTAGGQLIIVD